MKETEFENDCKTLANLMGWLCYKGQATDRNGAADILLMKDNHGFAVETKKPNETKKQRKSQVIEEQRCKERGVPYYLVNSLEEFKQAILTEESKL